MKKYVDLIKDIGKIKKVERSGWVREGIKNPESVADHSYRGAVMAMVFGPHLNVDTNKLIKMVLLHDLGEGAIGDKVVERGKDVDHKSRDEKDKAEILAVRKIFSAINEDEFPQLQAEALKMESREAIILKQLERLEMAVQALEYEEESNTDLSEFFNNADMHITDPFLKNILKEVISLRPKK